MGAPWINSVKQTHRLNYYLQGIAGQWQSAVQTAVREFNTISARRNLGVTFAPSQNAPTDSGGADVGIRTANGGTSASYRGSQYTTSLPGDALTGFTMRLYNPIEKAFIFLPSNPMIGQRSRARRATGLGVKKVIVFHELIHSCGLDNNDHTPTDVFNGYLDALVGGAAAQDRLQFLAGGQYRTMPPIIFSAATADKISRFWR